MTANKKFTVEAETKLENALQQLTVGVSLETVLNEANRDADWLHPLLEIAGEVSTLQQTIPAPAASLQKMLAHAEKLADSAPAALPPASPAKPGWFAGLINLFKQPPQLRVANRFAAMAVAVLFMFLACTVTGGGLSAAAQGSLPGQPLYRLKRSIEALSLTLTQDPLKREQLQETFTHRRRLETETLLQQGQQAQVTFEYLVETASETTIIAGGLTFDITPETVTDGQLLAGAYVRITALTQPPSTLQALTVTVIQPAPPTPTPTSTPSPTITPSPTQLPTVTATSPAEEENLNQLPPSDENDTSFGDTLDAINDDDSTDDDSVENEPETPGQDDADESGDSSDNGDASDDASNEDDSDDTSDDDFDDDSADDNDADDGSADDDNDNSGDDFEDDDSGDDFDDDSGDDFNDDSGDDFNDDSGDNFDDDSGDDFDDDSGDDFDDDSGDDFDDDSGDDFDDDSGDDFDDDSGDDFDDDSGDDFDDDSGDDFDDDDSGDDFEDNNDEDDNSGSGNDSDESEEDDDNSDS